MRSIIIKIAIGIFLLPGIAFLIRNYSTFASPSPELGVFMVQPSTSLVSSSASSSTPARGFEAFGHACGGPNGSFITGYTAYDGKRLSLWGAAYNSRAEADMEFQKRLQNAARVQEIGAKYNQQGKVIGKRAVVIFIVEDNEIAAILWTEQKSLSIIEAQSLDQAFEFEHTKIEQ
jgi:hypothetical protein